MAWLVEARDPYTGGHLWRVSQYCALLAGHAGLARGEVALIALGGFVHDLGKAGIPDAILRKAGPLDQDEYSVIKTHPELGRRLLESHPLSNLVMPAVWQHHETPDGRGYPRGLSGEQIPAMAAIVGVCDAFDAMTSQRPYRNGMPVAKALELIEKGAGSQFDRGFATRLVALGAEGQLDHVVGHSDDGIPLGRCSGCGPIIVIKRENNPGDQVFCPACGSGFALYRGDEGTLATQPSGAQCSVGTLIPSPDTRLIATLARKFSGGVTARG
ncbi:HD-GYP domain-containing protein [Pseudomonas sp. NPDC090202]|uniref:HD-GYP domain-containing protein n=1 Tax=unclassified Pseudomonas TaxID=196821 RepID=UPI0037F429C9